jgi:hypothetical protein
MSAGAEPDEFFIGWSGRTGPRLGRFLAAVAILCLVAMGFVGYGLSRRADDPAASLLRLGERDSAGAPVRPEDWGAEQVLRGHVSRLGYPLLHLPPSTAYSRGRVMLLTGDGKNGPTLPVAAGPMELRGSVLRRGSLEMLVVEGATLLPGSPELRPAMQEALGRWLIAGEICDGKCYAGAMRPGAGLAHKACANLCLTGEVPAVFVAADPVAGSHFLLLADADGGPVPTALLGRVGIPVTLQGEVERIGNVLVLRLDPQPARRP